MRGPVESTSAAQPAAAPVVLRSMRMHCRNDAERARYAEAEQNRFDREDRRARHDPNLVPLTAEAAAWVDEICADLSPHAPLARVWRDPSYPRPITEGQAHYERMERGGH